MEQENIILVRIRPATPLQSKTLKQPLPPYFGSLCISLEVLKTLEETFTPLTFNTSAKSSNLFLTFPPTSIKRWPQMSSSEEESDNESDYSGSDSGSGSDSDSDSNSDSGSGDSDESSSGSDGSDDENDDDVELGMENEAEEQVIKDDVQMIVEVNTELMSGDDEHGELTLTHTNTL